MPKKNSPRRSPAPPVGVVDFSQREARTALQVAVHQFLANYDGDVLFTLSCVSQALVLYAEACGIAPADAQQRLHSCLADHLRHIERDLYE